MMIYNRLHQHTHRNNIIASEQYGFKENSSTELAIFYLINQFLIQNNKKLVTSGIFCDLTKAFDTVDHHLLITKLKHFGIVGKFAELIESYLSDRYQRVIIKSVYSSNQVSQWELVKYEVPQGSLLAKLNSLGYMVCSLRPVLGLKIIKQIYLSYVHSVLNYGIMFWGTSPHSGSIFITQKRIVRRMMKAKPADSCRELFKKLGILTLYSQYIFSILMFVVKHKDLFMVNK
jgi:hypothetical protein